jgi:hypothetical protein
VVRGRGPGSTSRVGEFPDKGFTFIGIGNDLHHILTQATAYVSEGHGNGGGR